MELAEIIMGDDESIFTTYGRKSFCGLADMIDRKREENPTTEHAALCAVAEAAKRLPYDQSRELDLALSTLADVRSNGGAR